MHIEVIDPENAAKTTFCKFKREICVKLTAKHIALKKRKAVDDLECTPNRVLGTSDSAHMLLENINKQDVHCLFCLLRGQKLKSIYGCCACKKGFHVNCFTAYHCQQALEGDPKALVDLILCTQKSMPRNLKKKSKFISNISELKITR